MAVLVCPNCGESKLRSAEKATIMYPITAIARPHDGRTVEYTGEFYEVLDEGTEFQDELWCRGCGNETSLAGLMSLRRFAHAEPDRQKLAGVEEDSTKGSDIRFQGVCYAVHAVENWRYECGWASSWHHADDHDDHDDPAMEAWRQAEEDLRQHLRDEGVTNA